MTSIGSSDARSWQTSVLQAAGKCDEPKVREFIREGRAYGDTFKDTLKIALLRAVGRGHEPLVRLLLEEGAEVDVASHGEVPPLFRAADMGRDKMLQILLEYGASTEVKDKSKRTAIFPAAQRNHRTTLSLLLEAGADANVKDEDGQTVMLSLAAETSEKMMKWGSDIIKLLLRTNVDLEAKDKDGRTALLWTAATGKESFAKLLLTPRAPNKADIHAINNRGKTALHLAAESKTSRLALINLLLDHGANVTAESDGQWTPLHNAAERGHGDIASLLLDWGADVNAKLSNRMRPLHGGARNGHIEVVKVLLQQPNVRRDCKDSAEETPMLVAAQNGHFEIVKLLGPTNEGSRLSGAARSACEGFQATVVDFGMEHRSMNHKKYSILELLYGWDESKERPTVTTVVRNVPSKPRFRWIHLPTNNMTWVEALLKKHFVENSASDVDGYKALQKILGQQHRGPTIHSHFMRPLCQRMQATGKNVGSTNAPEHGAEKSAGRDMLTPIIVLPDQENAPIQSTGNFVDDNSDQKVATGDQRSKRAPKGPKKAPNSNGSKRADQSFPTKPASPNARRTKQSLRAPGPRAERSGNIVLFMPYLHYETHRKRKQMSDAIKRAENSRDRGGTGDTSSTCDEMLIQAYLQSTHNLQIRRTLDQFYYHAISTESRDTDQVVYRYTRDKGKEKMVFMVDQLWFWVLSDDLIVTSFPQRWEQPKKDPLNVLEGIIEDINSKTRPPVRSVYDLAMLITGKCIGVFDRQRNGSEDYQFLDMFESSIGEVTNRETELFKRFNDASVAAAEWLTNQRRRGKSQFFDSSSHNSISTVDPTFVDTLLDIGEETALLAETKDIRDELNMISMVLDHQLAVVDDLTHALLEELRGHNNQQKQAEIKKRFHEQQKVIEVHLKDVARMDQQAKGIYTSLTHLLDLKQKHANAIEARFARDQAAFTGRQGQTIMVFTIVTIVFLPMSFIAAVFTIPVREFPHDHGAPSMPLAYVSKIMFGVGLAISIPLIAVAFAVDNLGLLMKRGLRSLVFGRKRTQKPVEPFGGSRPQSGLEDDGEKDVMPRIRRSGDTYKRRSSYETDPEAQLGSWPIRKSTGHSRDRSWRDVPRTRNGLTANEDLETGGIRPN